MAARDRVLRAQAGLGVPCADCGGSDAARFGCVAPHAGARRPRAPAARHVLSAGCTLCCSKRRRSGGLRSKCWKKLPVLLSCRFGPA